MMQIVDCGYLNIRAAWKWSKVKDDSQVSGYTYKWTQEGHKYFSVNDAETYIYINSYKEEEPKTAGHDLKYSYHSYPFISFIDDAQSVSNVSLSLNVVANATYSKNEKFSIRMFSKDPRDLELPTDDTDYIESLYVQENRVDMPGGSSGGTFGSLGVKTFDVTDLYNYMLANPTETSRENAGNHFHTMILNPTGGSNVWLIQIATKIDYANGGIIFNGQTSPFSIQPVGSLSTGIFVGGVQKSIDSAYIRKNHAWHEVEEMYVRVGGEWRK